MSRFFLLLFLLSQAISASASAGGSGSGVGDGGGAAELAFVFTFDRLQRFLEPCLKTSLCGLDAEEAKVLAAISATLPMESPLVFVSDSEARGEAFQTGKTVGSPLKINKDRLWKLDAKAEPVALSLQDAFEMLMSALILHHPEFGSSVELTLVAKASRFSEPGTAAYFQNLGSPNIRALALSGQPLESLIVEDGFEQFLLLNGRIVTALGCAPEALKFFGPRWAPQDSSRSELILNVALSWRCAGSSVAMSGNLMLIFSVAPAKSAPATGSSGRLLELVSGAEPRLLLSGIHPSF